MRKTVETENAAEKSFHFSKRVFSWGSREPQKPRKKHFNALKRAWRQIFKPKKKKIISLKIEAHFC